jgi:predicted GIY-YIG superfamily endonuclease
MPNYQNGKIYRIVCNQTGLQYIGSTTIPLASRLSQHKKLFKDGKSGTSKLVLENNDYNIVLIEDYPCDRKEELLKRERYFIETVHCVNIKVPLQSQKEWYEKNKDRLIEQQKIWNNNNKDKLKQYQHTFRTKEKGIYVDLTNMDIDDENIKIEFEDIYNSPEFIENQKWLLENWIDDKVNNI